MNSVGAQGPEPGCLCCWIFRVLFAQFGLRSANPPFNLESIYDYALTIDHSQQTAWKWLHCFGV